MGATNPDVDAWFETFFPKAKKHVTSMVHQGAMLEDPDGILDGDGDTARSSRIVDRADLDAKADAIVGLVRSWIVLRDTR